MKRGFALLFLALLVVPLALVSGEEIPGLPGQLTPESLEQQQQRIMELQNVTNWQLLGTRFQQAMLKNPIVAGIDQALKNLDFLFLILFGMHYSLSMTLLFVMALWFIIAFDGRNVLKSYFLLSGNASLGISVGIAIIMAQTRALSGFVNSVGTLIFSRETWWARTIAIIIVVLAIIAFHIASKLYTKYLEQKRKKEEEHEAHVARQEEITYTRAKKRGEKAVEE